MCDYSVSRRADNQKPFHRKCRKNVPDLQQPARVEDEGGLCLTEYGPGGPFAIGYRPPEHQSCTESERRAVEGKGRYELIFHGMEHDDREGVRGGATFRVEGQSSKGD